MVANPMVTFLDQLREFEVLSPAQLKEVQGASLAQGENPVPLAKALLNKGWLTAFQANLLLKGRGAELILGNYRLQEPLGQGGMGTVYRANHVTMDRIVALKVIKKDKLTNPVAVQRFYKEIRAAAQLAHPNVVTAFDAGQAAGTHFFAMEYVEGIDLQKRIKDKGPLSVVEACDFIRQAALGLQHAFEKGLVHRDIKPANLLLSRASAVGSNHGTVKVLDMGLARVQGAAGDDGSITRVGTVVGTPEFMAPEQAIHSHAVDIRADLYSLGCTLFYLLTRQAPFTGESVPDLLVKHHAEEPPLLAKFRNDVPAGVQAIVSKLLAKKPEDRYQTPDELVQALTPFTRTISAPPGPEAITPIPNPAALNGSPWASATDLPVDTDDAPPSRRSYRRPIRGGPSKVLLAAAAAFLLLLGGGIVAAVMLAGDSKAKAVAQTTPPAVSPREKPETRHDAPPPRTEPVKPPPTMRDTTPPADKVDYVGSWKWSFGDKARDITMTIKMDGDKLTGTVMREGREMTVEEMKVHDGELTFRLAFMRNDGMKHHIHYSGKANGDTIKGKIDLGAGKSWDWEAKRVKS